MALGGLAAGELFLSDVRYIVVDEADTMLSSSSGFRQETLDLIHAIQVSKGLSLCHCELAT